MNVCNVLVVDDEDEALSQIAGHLSELQNSAELHRLGIQLNIELCDSAAWALEQSNTPPQRWNLVLSDVMMPSEQPGDPMVTETLDMLPVHRRDGDRGIPPQFDHGGFLIAQGLADLRRDQPNEVHWPKLVLLSSRLTGQDRLAVHAFEKNHCSWFRYLDKSETWGGDARAYQFALLQALSDYHKPDWAEEGFNPATKTWDALKDQAERLASQNDLRHLLIVGPNGSGKAYLSKYVFERRGIKPSDHQSLDAAELGLDDKKAILESHASSTDGALYISRPQVLMSTAYGEVARQIKADTQDPGVGRRLCIWSAESWEAIEASSVLVGQLLGEFQEMKRLTVHPLCADDVQAHARTMLHHLWPGYTLTTGAMEALSKAAWPNNLKSLRNALKDAVKNAGATPCKLDSDHFAELPQRTAGAAMAMEMDQTAPLGKEILHDLIVDELKALNKLNIKKDKKLKADYVMQHADTYPKLAEYANRNDDLFNTIMAEEKESSMQARYPRYGDIATQLMSNGRTSRKPETSASTQSRQKKLSSS